MRGSKAVLKWKSRGINVFITTKKEKSQKTIQFIAHITGKK
jgi:hypothetical protein